MSFKIKVTFYNSFKIGDNVNYNLDILNYLYELLEQSSSKKDLLYKPIIVSNVSIIEAILADFFKRINTNYVEGVPNLGEVFDSLRGKKISDFRKYLIQAEKEDLFDQGSVSNLHEILLYLQAVRNRVHIQDFYRHKEIQGKLSKNDKNVFIEKYKRSSERCLEFLIKKMNEKYPRPEHTHHVDDHALPWEEHFPNFPDLE